MATNLGMNFSASQKQNAGDSFTAHLAGMSKNQLFDVMSQMKVANSQVYTLLGLKRYPFMVFDLSLSLSFAEFD